MPQGVVEVHGTAAHHAERPRDPALHQLLGNVVAEFYPHDMSSCFISVIIILWYLFSPPDSDRFAILVVGVQRGFAPWPPGKNE